MLSDAELVRRCLAGNEDSWRFFVDRFRRPIWHISYRFTANPDDADELTQEIFMRLLTVLPRYRPSGALAAWVRRVATNAGIDFYRHRRRAPRMVAEDHVPEARLPRRGQPDSIAERREEAVRVRRLLASLPPDLAEPVMLRDLMDYAYPEIARRLGIPVGTVKSRIHRGRRALARRNRHLAGNPAKEAAG